MKNKTIEIAKTGETGHSAAVSKSCEGAQPVEQFQAAMRILTGKWKGEILWHLTQRTHRFGELRSAIHGITQHMLTTQLRDLETHGLVKRTVFPEVPPRVEYELTEAALGLQPVFQEIMRWAEAHMGVLNLPEEDGQPDQTARPRRAKRSPRA